MTDQVKAKRNEIVTASVSALSNLTDAQRATVLDIALSYADKHSMQIEDLDADKESTRRGAPHYENLANHVRNNVK